MRFVLLATLVVFAFAQPAASEISAGPPGLINMVDANGKIVGGVIELDGGYNGNTWVVSLDTSGGAGFVYVGGDHLAFQTSRVFFSEPDCTGAAYTHEAYLSLGLDGGLGLIVEGNQHLYAATGSLVEVQVRSSYGSDTSNCSPETACTPISRSLTLGTSPQSLRSRCLSRPSWESSKPLFLFTSDGFLVESCWGWVSRPQSRSGRQSQNLL